MKFSYPYMFYLVWLVLLLGGILVYGNKKRKKILSGFAGKEMLFHVIPGYSVKRRTLKSVILLLALLLIVISLAGPLVGFKWEKIREKGVDIMICLDCSKSMLAQDIKPNRLERAKHEIIDLLRMMKSDRAGLVAFAGDSVLQCPLTMDYSAFNIFLNALNPDYMPVGGTDIGGAIETALNGFEKNVNSDKAIIIITDGENTSGRPVKAAEKAAKLGVKIFCIGVGSLGGAPIPAKKGGFIKDSSGRIIMSKVNDKELKKIAAITDGRYVRSVAGNMDLDIIYKQDICKTMTKKTLKSTRRKIWENRFQWFLFPALILLFAELLIDEKKKDIPFIIFLIVLSMISFQPAKTCYAGVSSSVKKGIVAFSNKEYDKAEKNFIDAQLQRPQLPDIYYDIGTAAYKKKDFKSALKNFKKAINTTKKDLKIKARYNLANTEYRLGQLENAVNDYERVLKLDPDNKNAMENLEFVKKKIKAQKKKKQQNNKNNQDKNNKNKGKNKNQPKKNKSGKNQKTGNTNARETNSMNTNHNSGKNKKNNQKNGNQRQPAATRKNSAGSEKKKQNRQSRKINSSNAGKSGIINKQNDIQPPGRESPLTRTEEMMLNRLEDKPGRAMIPAYKKNVIKKDW